MAEIVSAFLTLRPDEISRTVDIDVTGSVRFAASDDPTAFRLEGRIVGVDPNRDDLLFNMSDTAEFAAADAGRTVNFRLQQNGVRRNLLQEDPIGADEIQAELRLVNEVSGQEITQRSSNVVTLRRMQVVS